MHYLPELYYFQEQKDFPFRQAVLITAITVSRWCTYFYARVIAPKSKHISPVEKSGLLPRNAAAREVFVADLVSWLLDNSFSEELFYLFLDDEPVPKSGKVAKFDHHDDTCCWVLSLTKTEFAQLQAVWKTNGLPEDLFYPKPDSLCVAYPGNSLQAKLLRALGIKKCYTPKQWEHKKVTDSPTAAATDKC